MKKVLSIALTLALVFALFAACGTGTPQATEAPAQTEAPAATPAPATEAPAEPARYPLAEERVTLTCLTQVPDANKSVTTPEEFGYYAVAADKLNVDVEWDSVSADALTEMLNILIAGGEYPDIINCTQTSLAGSIEYNVEQNVVYDVSTLVEEYAPEYYGLIMGNEDYYRNLTNSKGKINAFYILYQYAPLEWGAFARADWMEALGFEDLTTYQDWHDFALAAKTEYNAATPLLFAGNATIFNYQMSGGYGVVPFATDEAQSHYYQVDGVVHSSLMEEGYRDYLKMCAQWFSEGIISSDYLTVPSIPFIPTREAQMLSGSALFASNVVMMDYYNPAGVDEGYRIVGVPDPVVKAGDQVHFTYATSYNSKSVIFITTDCETPEIAVAYINYFYTDEGMLDYNYGVEGETFNVDNGEITLTDLVMGAENPSNEIYLHSGSNQMFGLVEKTRYTRFYSQASLDAVAAWESNSDAEYYLPLLTVNADSYPNYAATLAEITTYAAESVHAFISGAKSIDTEWDAYVGTLKQLGLEDCLAAYQACLDATLAK